MKNLSEIVTAVVRLCREKKYEEAHSFVDKECSNWVYGEIKSMHSGIFVKSGEFQKALDCMNFALSDSPNDVAFLMERGKIYFRIQKYRLSLKDFEKAIALESTVEYHPFLMTNKLLAAACSLKLKYSKKAYSYLSDLPDDYETRIDGKTHITKRALMRQLFS